jgi:hypothetical protein
MVQMRITPTAVTRSHCTLHRRKVATTTTTTTSYYLITAQMLFTGTLVGRTALHVVSLGGHDDIVRLFT